MQLLKACFSAAEGQAHDGHAHGIHAGSHHAGQAVHGTRPALHVNAAGLHDEPSTGGGQANASTCPTTSLNKPQPAAQPISQPDASASPILAGRWAPTPVVCSPSSSRVLKDLAASPASSRTTSRTFGAAAGDPSSPAAAPGLQLQQLQPLGSSGSPLQAWDLGLSRSGQQLLLQQAQQQQAQQQQVVQSLPIDARPGGIHALLPGLPGQVSGIPVHTQLAAAIEAAVKNSGARDNVPRAPGLVCLSDQGPMAGTPGQTSSRMTDSAGRLTSIPSRTAAASNAPGSAPTPLRPIAEGPFSSPSGPVQLPGGTVRLPTPTSPDYTPAALSPTSPSSIIPEMGQEVRSSSTHGGVSRPVLGTQTSKGSSIGPRRDVSWLERNLSSALSSQEGFSSSVGIGALPSAHGSQNQLPLPSVDRVPSERSNSLSGPASHIPQRPSGTRQLQTFHSSSRRSPAVLPPFLLISSNSTDLHQEGAERQGSAFFSPSSGPSGTAGARGGSGLVGASERRGSKAQAGLEEKDKDKEKGGLAAMLSALQASRESIRGGVTLGTMRPSASMTGRVGERHAAALSSTASMTTGTPRGVARSGGGRGEVEARRAASRVWGSAGGAGAAEGEGREGPRQEGQGDEDEDEEEGEGEGEEGEEELDVAARLCSEAFSASRAASGTSTVHAGPLGSRSRARGSWFVRLSALGGANGVAHLEGQGVVDVDEDHKEVWSSLLQELKEPQP